MSDEQQGHRSGTVGSSDGSGELDDRSALVARVQELEAEVLKARHAQLLNRDHVVGVEAEIGRQNADIIRLNVDLRKLQGRAKRLNARKIAQAKRIAGLQAKLDNVRKQNAALTRRVGELEASAVRPSLARRVVRRVRGTGR
jgi:chromosome segregation ATPase